MSLRRPFRMIEMISFRKVPPQQRPAIALPCLVILLIFIIWFSSQFLFLALCVPNRTEIVPPISKNEIAQDYNHPLVQLLTANSSASVWLIAFLAAVIAAPVIEEFLFRFLLQNYLESKIAPFFSAGKSQIMAVGAVSLLFALLHGGPRGEQSADIIYYGFVALLLASLTTLAAGIAYIRFSRHMPFRETFFGGEKFFRAGFFRYAAICLGLVLCTLALSNMLQTAFRGFNTDPVPIFCISVIFGLLYCRTRNLLYSVLLHACLNGTSLFLVWCCIRVLR